MKLNIAVTTAMLFVVAASAATPAPKGPGEHHWTFDAAPASRHVIGWAIYRVIDGKVGDDLECGENSDWDRPMSRPVDVSMTAIAPRKGYLKMVVTTDAGTDRTSRLVSDEGRMHERTVPPVTRLTSRYQILWAADWVTKDGRLAKSMAFVGRVVPAADKSMSFDASDIERLKLVLTAAEPRPATTKPMATH